MRFRIADFRQGRGLSDIFFFRERERALPSSFHQSSSASVVGSTRLTMRWRFFPRICQPSLSSNINHAFRINNRGWDSDFHDYKTDRSFCFVLIISATNIIIFIQGSKEIKEFFNFLIYLKDWSLFFFTFHSI